MTKEKQVKGTQARFSFPDENSCQSHISVTVHRQDEMVKLAKQASWRICRMSRNLPELNENYPIPLERSTTRI